MPERTVCDLLIVGAGPFGLSLAAATRDRDIDYRILGEPMSFWRDNMPSGMWLRSGPDWHLDPSGEATFEAFWADQDVAAPEGPLKLATYLEYCDWFQRRKQIEPHPVRLQRLDYDAESATYQADCGDVAYEASAVVLAVGFQYFVNVPAEFPAMLPAGRFAHTCDAVDMDADRGRRVLIVGGRQSAFESAALLREAGAQEIHLSYRHPTPRFEESDWSWVVPMLETAEQMPGWFGTLDADERTALNARFWTEGRLKLEPWLAPRIDASHVHLWPESRLAGCEEQSDSSLEVRLDTGTIVVDDVLLATGYRVDLRNVPFLAAGNVLGQVEVRDGFPCLNAGMESSLPGLYFTSMAATQDFGSFFGFTVAARTSARTIGAALAARGAA